jgi:radical SAM protein with 4Fe4S-binding SPASM domain
MDLIVKPTLACNYKCTFCSSTTNPEGAKVVLDLDMVRRFIVRYPETQVIIINGGDPLMVEPQYYWDLIAILDDLKSPAKLSFTSNLWAYYKKPSMWVELFNHPRVGVGTSFQYGDARLKGDLKPFTEDEFWAISDMFLRDVGERLDFIAVIDQSNADTVIRTVELARDMNVVAKINPAFSSGEQVVSRGITMGNAGSAFLLADIYAKYVEIHEAGLTEWEYNTTQLTHRLRDGRTSCPQNRECDSGIRNLEPNGQYNSCGSFGDDKLYLIDFESEMAGGFSRPLQVPELLSMKDSCFSCPMFAICNGCRKTIHDHKSLGMVESHCRKMKTLAPKIIAMNGLTGVLEPTPYVDESVSDLIFKG